jgi:hypothetical protein
VREIEISHWGNVQVTEHYNIVHGGAKSKGEFSRSVTLSLCVSIMLVIAIIFKI